MDSVARVIWLLPLVTLVAYLITRGIRRYALERSLMDIPNERSSHDVPTPRGGGVAIVLCFLMTILLMAGMSLLEMENAIALAGAGGFVGIIGFIDDHGHVAARWRLVAHFLAAIWALAWLMPIDWVNVILPGVPGWVGFVLLAVFLVWLLNLYNFMDGIDGIASVEAISVCCGGAALFWLKGEITTALVPLALAAAVAGFLIWNFPPAKIFMGDTGSGFLGMTLGVLSLIAGSYGAEYFWGWLILLGTFIVDATWTLARRALRGDAVYEAHRSHAYQHASRMFGGHLPVMLWVVAINILWLMPLALLVGLGLMPFWIGVLVAYVPLTLLAIGLQAGVEGFHVSSN